MYLGEMGCEAMDWVQLIHDRVQWWTGVNTVMDLPIQLKAENFSTS
jgi:hypothetical protein